MTRCAGCRHRLDDESTRLVVTLHGSLLGDQSVEAHYRRPEPWNKCCRCAAHREYFGDALD